MMQSEGMHNSAAHAIRGQETALTIGMARLAGESACDGAFGPSIKGKSDAETADSAVAPQQ
jgi:hypothetical protein